MYCYILRCQLPLQNKTFLFTVTVLRCHVPPSFPTATVQAAANLAEHLVQEEGTATVIGPPEVVLVVVENEKSETLLRNRLLPSTAGRFDHVRKQTKPGRRKLRVSRNATQQKRYCT